MNKELVRTIKFTLFSISAGLMQIGSFTILNEIIKLDYWICYLISLILSIIWNFTLNRKHTFKSNCNIKIAYLQITLYYLIFTPLSTYGGDYLVKAGFNEYIVEFLSMALNFITEYLFDRFIVFKDTIDTN